MKMRIETIDTRYGKFTVYGTERYFKNIVPSIKTFKHERPIVKYIEENGKNYDLLIDVGANYGYYGVIASPYISKIVEVEAHPVRYGFLLWNTQDVSNVECMRAFVGTEDSKPTTIETPNGMVSITTNKEVKVPIISLDRLDYIFNTESNKRILIKIDVEGNELSVLDSGKKMLENKLVDWIVEIHKIRGITEQEVFDRFKNHTKKIMINGKKISHYLFKGK